MWCRRRLKRSISCPNTTPNEFTAPAGAQGKHRCRHLMPTCGRSLEVQELLCAACLLALADATQCIDLLAVVWDIN